MMNNKTIFRGVRCGYVALISMMFLAVAVTGKAQDTATYSPAIVAKKAIECKRTLGVTVTRSGELMCGSVKMTTDLLDQELTNINANSEDGFIISTDQQAPRDTISAVFKIIRKHHIEPSKIAMELLDNKQSDPSEQVENK